MPENKPAVDNEKSAFSGKQTLQSETLALWRSAMRTGADSEQTVTAKPRSARAGARIKVNRKHLGEPGQSAPATSGPDNQCPDFELIELLGEGGMGLVYLARQTSIDRKIALKMLRPERNGDEACRMAFLDEAAVTGRLDHPNIVPVHDLGRDDHNRLFYVMKEVKGQRWSEVLRQKGQIENLDIFLRVTDAIAFAHTRGVIHRDIKPGNVMLGDFGEVIVMDWGLACAAGAESPAGRVSQETALCGTPAYMAPEMALADIARIGKASDIYLLGAMLYEIVTGRPPRSERDPLACLLQAVENRIDPADDESELLEIALKSMRARPEARYASVKEMQEAVRGYQSHTESVMLADRAHADLDLARLNGQYELFSRSVYRFSEALALWPGNKRATAGLGETRKDYAECALSRDDLDLALSVLAEDRSMPDLRERIVAAVRDRDTRRKRLRTLKWTSTGLAAGVVLSLAVGFLLVKSQRDRALLAEARQTEARRQAENLIDFMTFDLRRKLSGLGRLSLMDDINRAVESYHRKREVEMASEGKKLTAAELRRRSASQHSIGDVLRAQGNPKDALSAYREALKAFATLAERAPGKAGPQRDLAYSHNSIGEVLRDLGSLGDALHSHRQALAIRERLARDDPRNADLQSAIAASHANIGEILLEQGRRDDALATFRRAFAIRNRLAREAPDNAVWQSDLSVSQIHVGDTLCALGNPGEALNAYRQALSIRERLAHGDLENKVWQRELAVNRIRFGDALLAQQKTDQALKEYRTATEVLEQLAGSDPENAGWQRDLSTGHIKIAAVLREMLDLESALAEYQTAKSTLERLTGIDPGNALWQRDLSVIQIDIGDILRMRDKPFDALKEYRQALAIRQRLSDSAPDNIGWTSDLAVSHFKVGNAQSEIGAFADALAAYRQALAIRELLTKLNPGHTDWQRGLSLCRERIAEIEKRLRKPDD